MVNMRNFEVTCYIFKVMVIYTREKCAQKYVIHFVVSYPRISLVQRHEVCLCEQWLVLNWTVSFSYWYVHSLRCVSNCDNSTSWWRFPLLTQFPKTI